MFYDMFGEEIYPGCVVVYPRNNEMKSAIILGENDKSLITFKVIK